MVVLPTPGGPHKMQLCGCPDSNANRNAFPSPNRCCWPATCPKCLGRSRSAKGRYEEEGCAGKIKQFSGFVPVYGSRPGKLGEERFEH